MHRREFLRNGAVALTVAATMPLFAFQGANNRVRMAVIGMGGRAPERGASRSTPRSVIISALGGSM